jgi:hypothetical protein
MLILILTTYAPFSQAPCGQKCCSARLGRPRHADTGAGQHCRGLVRHDAALPGGACANPTCGPLDVCSAHSVNACVPNESTSTCYAAGTQAKSGAGSFRSMITFFKGGHCNLSGAEDINKVAGWSRRGDWCALCDCCKVSCTRTHYQAPRLKRTCIWSALLCCRGNRGTCSRAF